MKKLLSTAIILYETEASWRNLLISAILLTLVFWMIAPSQQVVTFSNNTPTPAASFTPDIVIPPLTKNIPEIEDKDDAYAVSIPEQPLPASKQLNNFKILNSSQ